MKKLNKLIATMLALACAVTALVMPVNVRAATLDEMLHGDINNYKYDEVCSYYIISNESGTHEGRPWTKKYEYTFETDYVIVLVKNGDSYRFPNLTYWNDVFQTITVTLEKTETGPFAGHGFSTVSDWAYIVLNNTTQTNIPIVDSDEEAVDYIIKMIKSYTNPNSIGVQICYDVYDTFEIAVPKKVELSKGNAETIPMNVKGDLAGLSTLDITPEATMTLTQSPKDPVTVNLSMVKGSFSFAELLGDGQITGITIDASGLSAGEWTGSCIVNVNITDHTGE